MMMSRCLSVCLSLANMSFNLDSAEGAAVVAVTQQESRALCPEPLLVVDDVGGPAQRAMSDATSSCSLLTSGISHDVGNRELVSNSVGPRTGCSSTVDGRRRD